MQLTDSVLSGLFCWVVVVVVVVVYIIYKVQVGGKEGRKRYVSLSWLLSVCMYVTT